MNADQEALLGPEVGLCPAERQGRDPGQHRHPAPQKNTVGNFQKKPL